MVATSDSPIRLLHCACLGLILLLLRTATAHAPDQRAAGSADRGAFAGVSADGATDGVTVGQVEFSIRVRRALETLGIRTLGDLAAKSEVELMGCPNFGQTSVNEVHAKLAGHGLRLAES